VSKEPVCGYCGQLSEKVTGRDVYPLRADLSGRMFYKCVPCDAFIGCHPGTDTPLGTLADAKLRKMRSKAHTQFDPLWKGGFLKRKQAYAALAQYLGVPVDDCHIGLFNSETCDRVISFSLKYMHGQISMEFI
jgi:hypothetical protein